MFYPLCKLRKVVSRDNHKGGAYARGAHVQGPYGRRRVGANLSGYPPCRAPPLPRGSGRQPGGGRRYASKPSLVAISTRVGYGQHGGSTAAYWFQTVRNRPEPPPPPPLPPPVTPEPPPWSRPEFAWAGGKAKDGSRCVCLRCCLIDLTLGSCEQYVLAFSAFLDGLLDRSSDERLTVLVDNRPGDGAPNVPGIKLLPLGQQMSRTLSDQCAPPARNRA